MRSRRSTASSPSQMRIELVTTIRSSTAASASTKRHVVVPAVSPIAVPGRTSSAAARAIARFSSICSVDLTANPGSTVVADGSVAPPCTLCTRPSRVSRSRSRRMVMSLTPSCVVRSLTRAEPWRCTWAAINSRRRRASIRVPPPPGVRRPSRDLGVGVVHPGHLPTMLTRSQQIRSSRAPSMSGCGGLWWNLRVRVLTSPTPGSRVWPTAAPAAAPLGGTCTCHVQLVARPRPRRHRRARSARCRGASCSPERAPRWAPACCSAAPVSAWHRRPGCAPRPTAAGCWRALRRPRRRGRSRSAATTPTTCPRRRSRR